MKRLSVFATLIVLTLAAASSVRAQRDPRIGTWKLNLAKSKFSPGPAPASETRKYEAQGRDIMATVERVDAQGNHISQRFNATADGEDYPTGSANGPATISIMLFSPNTWEGTSKNGGKVVSTIRAVLSQDGKVFTFTTKGTDAQGQAVVNVAVFDRQ